MLLVTHHEPRQVKMEIVLGDRACHSCGPSHFGQGGSDWTD